MTKKERFLAAVRGEVPAVVPVAPLIHCRYANKILGRWDWRAIFEVHKMLGSIHFRGPIHPGLEVSLPDGWGQESKLIENSETYEAHEHLIRTPKALLTGKYVQGMLAEDPLVAREVEFPLKNRNDRQIYNSYLQQFVSGIGGYDTTEMQQAYDVMADDGVASVSIGCSLNQLLMMRGMEDLLFDLVDIPDLIQAVWRTHCVIVEKYLEAFLASPNEVLWCDIWSTSVLNVALFKRWVLPEIRAIVEKVRAAPGKYVGLYAVGKLRHLMPMIAEVKPDFVEPFEPYPLGNMALCEAKSRYGKQLCIMGNFDTVLLAFGTPEQARRETLRCLDEAMEGGAYVLVTSDEVPADARPENLRAMIDTVEERGRY